jgi:hypothetical protein
MERATENTKHREFLDRLTLLLIARPETGWEEEFKGIRRREIQRLAVPASESGRDERS